MTFSDRWPTGAVPRRPRQIPCDPQGLFLEDQAVSPESFEAEGGPEGESWTFEMLAEGGLSGERLDRLLLAIRYEEPVVLAVLLGVTRGQAARQRRHLLARARWILLAATLREALGVGGQAVIDVESGQRCDDLKPDELDPTGPVRASGLRLATLARAVRVVESDRNGRGRYLCAVRAPGGCHLWPALPRCGWILPFAPALVQMDPEPILLPMRRGA